MIQRHFKNITLGSVNTMGLGSSFYPMDIRNYGVLDSGFQRTLGIIWFRPLHIQDPLNVIHQRSLLVSAYLLPVTGSLDSAQGS